MFLFVPKINFICFVSRYFLVSSTLHIFHPTPNTLKNHLVERKEGEWVLSVNNYSGELVCSWQIRVAVQYIFISQMVTLRASLCRPQSHSEHSPENTVSRCRLLGSQPIQTYITEEWGAQNSLNSVKYLLLLVIYITIVVL